jgi:hypothetical protein
MNVFLTVDTEIWPRSSGWRESRLAADFDRDIRGVTARGQFGLPFQIEMLNQHGLKAVFFTESLFACAVGSGPLADIVGMVQDGGHEVQLHIHPEWLAWMPQSILPGRNGQYLKDFTKAEQVKLIACGLENLKSAKAKNVCAFRAGNYGANFDTLRALAENGVLYDSSHNTCYIGPACDLDTGAPLLQPAKLHGVYEFPVSYFRDWPRHYRHAQLCACSAGELEHALLGAWEQGWHSFVIVSHSFELLKNRKQAETQPVPDRIVIHRFERLCGFLAENRDKFRTAGFSDLQAADIPVPAGGEVLQGTMPNSVRRLVEQLVSRLW